MPCVCALRRCYPYVCSLPVLRCFRVGLSTSLPPSPSSPPQLRYATYDSARKELKASVAAGHTIPANRSVSFVVSRVTPSDPFLRPPYAAASESLHSFVPAVSVAVMTAAGQVWVDEEQATEQPFTVGTIQDDSLRMDTPYVNGSAGELRVTLSCSAVIPPLAKVRLHLPNFEAMAQNNVSLPVTNGTPALFFLDGQSGPHQGKGTFATWGAEGDTVDTTLYAEVAARTVLSFAVKGLWSPQLFQSAQASIEVVRPIPSAADVTLCRKQLITAQSSIKGKFVDDAMYTSDTVMAKSGVALSFQFRTTVTIPGGARLQITLPGFINTGGTLPVVNRTVVPAISDGWVALAGEGTWDNTQGKLTIAFTERSSLTSGNDLATKPVVEVGSLVSLIVGGFTNPTGVVSPDARMEIFGLPASSSKRISSSTPITSGNTAGLPTLVANAIINLQPFLTGVMEDSTITLETTQASTPAKYITCVFRLGQTLTAGDQLILNLPGFTGATDARYVTSGFYPRYFTGKWISLNHDSFMYVEYC